jgi:hypothetical protein
MCENKIYNNKDYRLWALKNHPDKFRTKLNKVELEKYDEDYKNNSVKILECIDQKDYCTEEDKDQYDATSNSTNKSNIYDQD